MSLYICQTSAPQPPAPQPPQPSALRSLPLHHPHSYARTASKDKRADWASLTEQYFTRRSSLAAILLLVDASLPPKAVDLAAAQWLAGQGLTHALVFTKTDKRKGGEPPPPDNVAAFRKELVASGLLPPPCFATSAASGAGRLQLLTFLAALRKRCSAEAAAAEHS